MEITAEYLADFAKHTTSSPLYTHLASVIAANEELMRVTNRIEHSPQPLVLLAGVQFLLARHQGHPLAHFYPNLTSHPAPVEQVDVSFTDFVLENEEELLELGRERHTQTNEARRCVALLPAIWAGEHDRFHLVDVGTSAGLNLALDRYRYRWGGVEWGPDSSVQLETELRGAAPAPREVEVLSRTGLDLSPVDPADPDDRDWLKALVWPEAEERRSRLRAALELAAGLPIRLVAGDAVETLPAVLDELPVGEAAVVMNAFTFNQLSEEQRLGIEGVVAGARGSRPVLRVWLELIDVEGQGADLKVDSGKGWSTVGKAQPHGEWLEL